ncbi:hypothetical protein G7046_g6025 [Stylonectria norvegica]|nr:hypothetical protein G7046_g6025 [Stylonectria norvegica]
MDVLGILRSQFTTLPYPEEDCTDRTVIVTGANTGLGLEAAKHFVRLGAAKVIVACRNIAKGEDAKIKIEEATQRPGVVEVWQLDLASFASVKEFAARAVQLDRLDILVNNASVLTPRREIVEGHELQITVNVISTLLLSVLLLPALRRTASQLNITPHIVIVSSDGAYMAAFKERNSEHILHALDENPSVMDRYTTSKLLQLMVLRRLAAAIDASGKGHVLVNGLNPGFCKTELFRQYGFPLNIAVWAFSALLARQPEMGSRTLLSAAVAGEETHGQWMSDCKVAKWPQYMTGEEGEKLTEKVWEELLEVVEEIEPGVTKNI